MLIVMLMLVGLLALANGANDNCKGVATLVGYGAASPRKALLWAMVTTVAGSLASLWLAGGLIARFSGNGLFEHAAPLHSAFFIAVLIGAFGWVMFATLSGMPVSTTHAIIGAFSGAGIVAFGAQMLHWSFFGMRFAMPLALIPLLSMSIVYVVAYPVTWLTARFAARCLCVRSGTALEASTGVAFAAGAPSVMLGSDEICQRAGATPIASTASVANAVHWFSSGVVGFARGWNDAPKIAALGIGGMMAANVEHGQTMAFVIVTVAMALGGMLAGRKVLETLARRVTPMPLGESLTASLTTAALVSLASWRGLPVSTTHVATGAVIGAGLRRNPREVHWGKVSEIVFSWLVTLPVAALLAGAAAWPLF